jgi:hypothetical protein
MTLILTILFLGALLTGAMFMTWKCGEFMAEHGGKFVHGALVLTMLLLVYVCVSLWATPLPGVDLLNDALKAATDTIKNKV